MPNFTKSLKASTVAENLNLNFIGVDQEALGISPLDEASAGYICFHRKSTPEDLFIQALNNGAIIVSSVTEHMTHSGTILISDHPEEDFCNLIERALREGLLSNQTSNGAFDKNTQFFGRREMLMKAIIFSGVRIGMNCNLKPLSVIGAPGFGVFRGRDSNYRHFPHIGGVILGDNVEIGSLSTVASGTLTPTTIKSYTKIDDHVHVAHNVQIGENVVICAGVTIGGGAKIGDNVWIGMDSVIRDGVTVGKDITIGMGTLVTKSINFPGLYIGQPAKFFRSEV